MPFPNASRVAPRAVYAAWSLRSFRTQVALGFAGLAIAVAVTLALAMGWMFAQKSRHDEEVDLRGIARNAAKLLADGLSFRSRELESLANSQTLWSEGLASNRVAQMLERIRMVTPHSAWIGVVSPDGRVQSAIDGLLVGQSMTERPWFQEGRSGTHLGDVHAAKLLASLLPPGSDGGPQRFVDFASPIRRDGKLIGVIGMHGSWEWTRAVVESLLPDDASARSLEVVILDREGQPIYASPGSTARRAAKAQPLDIDPATHEKYLIAAVQVRADSRVRDLGWSVVAREPERTALDAARRGVEQSLVFALLASSGACGLGWWLATRMTRPLKRIADAACDVEAGVEGASIPVLGNNPEIAQLSSALAGMTSRLQAANQELEARVRERTAALEQANQELDRQTRTDPLSGLLNRRGFEDQFARAVASGRRRRSPVSVLMIDIDHFKRVNDSFGHEGGDLVLQALASVLVRRLRETDVIARIGGEEFAVLLPDTEGVQASRVAQALVALVADEPMGGAVGRVTISCGVARLHLESDSPQTALARADTALYRAKADGRNRACVDADLELELEGA